MSNNDQPDDGPKYTSKRKSTKPRLVRDRLQANVFLVPTIITSVSFFCGFLAILSAFKGRFDYATKCIGLAFILDGLDGQVARRLNATSAFGKEIDSLSDAVAFGIAPAMLLYCWAFNQHADELGVIVAFLYAVCGAMRLARFNIDTVSRNHFKGLPIPGAAIALASLVYLYPTPLSNHYLIGGIMLYTILLAGLMHTSFRYFSIKHFKLSKKSVRTILLIVTVVVLIAWWKPRETLVVVATLYALSGLAEFCFRKVTPGVHKRLTQRYATSGNE